MKNPILDLNVSFDRAPQALKLFLKKESPPSSIILMTLPLYALVNFFIHFPYAVMRLCLTLVWTTHIASFYTVKNVKLLILEGNFIT